MISSHVQSSSDIVSEGPGGSEYKLEVLLIPILGGNSTDLGGQLLVDFLSPRAT